MPTDTPLWQHSLPAKILFTDCETTGTAMEDRMVSLGMILLETERLAFGHVSFTYLHEIFNPERPSHPIARGVHGYDDWTLSHQPPFRDSAQSVLELLAKADLMVAHNMVFDRRFLERELILATQAGNKRPVPPTLPPTHCTMLAHRATVAGSAKLDVVLKHWKMNARGKIHGALQDAWLCMQVYLKQQGSPFVIAVPDGMDPHPANFVQPPPKPTGWTL